MIYTDNPDFYPTPRPLFVWFKDERLLAQLNYICGSHFGWLPSEGEQERNPEARKMVAREFGDIGEVALLSEG